MSRSVRERLAAAPITWGVCEVPGWGHQLTPHEVLADMASLGFTHTEMGSVGFLPDDGAELATTLSGHGLSLLGGFVAVVLHDPDRHAAELARADAVAAQMAAAGATWFVSCPVWDHDDWQRPPLSEAQWAAMYQGLARIDAITAAHGIRHAFHPHVGALVQDDAETRAVLANTPTPLVLDTAHLTIGGSSPRALVDSHADRIGLIHLKDLDAAVARRLRAGELTLMEAVQQGLFPPLGRGSIPLADIIAEIERVRPGLSYVLEQDAALDGDGPDEVERLRRRVMESLAFVRDFDAAHGRHTGERDLAAFN